MGCFLGSLLRRRRVGNDYEMAVKPRILGRRLVARTRIFRIEQMDLAFANGNHRCFERILGGRGSVLVVPVPDPRTLLLTCEYAAGPDRYELGFPKGIAEPGEDPLEAAGRKLREELGFGARDLRLIHKVSPAPGYMQHETHLILARELIPTRRRETSPSPLRSCPGAWMIRTPCWPGTTLRRRAPSPPCFWSKGFWREGRGCVMKGDP